MASFDLLNVSFEVNKQDPLHISETSTVSFDTDIVPPEIASFDCGQLECDDLPNVSFKTNVQDPLFSELGLSNSNCFKSSHVLSEITLSFSNFSISQSPLKAREKNHTYRGGFSFSDVTTTWSRQDHSTVASNSCPDVTDIIDDLTAQSSSLRRSPKEFASAVPIICHNNNNSSFVKTHSMAADPIEFPAPEPCFESAPSSKKRRLGVASALSQNSTQNSTLPVSSRATMPKWSAEEDERLREAVKLHGIPNWTKIAKHVGARGNKACRQRWFYTAKPELQSVRKGKWKPDEDNKLRQLVQAYKTRNTRVWKSISRDMGYTRNHKQVRDRWNHHLDPSLRHGPWTEQEDTQLLKLHDKYSQSIGKWKKISSELVGRCSEQVRRHFTQLTKDAKAQYSE